MIYNPDTIYIFFFSQLLDIDCIERERTSGLESAESGSCKCLSGSELFTTVILFCRGL